MEGLVEFLLKYRPSAFSRGSLAFSPPIPVWVIWLVVGAIAAFGVLQYARSSESLGRRDRVILGVLRLVAVAALGFSLARPVLVIAESVTQRNIVAVLVDDSRSMPLASQQVGGAIQSVALGVSAQVQLH